jgi:hypothetical protein
MKVTQSTIQLYQLRNIDNGGWADISIDEGKNSGRISIASDWGTWQYYWNSCGKPFKQFLIDLRNDMPYVAGKMNADRWFDFDATIKKLKEDVLVSRRNEQIDKEQARLIYDEIKEIDNACSISDRNHFYDLLATSDNLSEWRYDAETETDVTPQFKAFWQKAFLPFLTYLEQELNIDNLPK